MIKVVNWFSEEPVTGEARRRVFDGLNIDFSKSTQFAQPFSVVSVDQDGFTSAGSMAWKLMHPYDPSELY